jgi:hypothetical protein
VLTSIRADIPFLLAAVASPKLPSPTQFATLQLARLHAKCAFGSSFALEYLLGQLAKFVTLHSQLWHMCSLFEVRSSENYVSSLVVALLVSNFAAVLTNALGVLIGNR